jgi:hypothetical protein
MVDGARSMKHCGRDFGSKGKGKGELSFQGQDEAAHELGQAVRHTCCSESHTRAQYLRTSACSASDSAGFVGNMVRCAFSSGAPFVTNSDSLAHSVQRHIRRIGKFGILVRLGLFLVYINWSFKQQTCNLHRLKRVPIWQIFPILRIW